MKKRTKIKKIRQSNRKIQILILIIILLALALLQSPVFATTQHATVLPAPDLALNVSDISFSPENPTLGRPVNITAIVHNVGNDTARNITVDFCINSIQVIIREEIDEIPPHSKKSVSINYIFLSVGAHSITVKIDPNIQVTKFITVVETPAGGSGGGGKTHYYSPSPSPTALTDTLPPIISNVTVTLEDSVIISWDTNEISDSLVKCGMKSRQYTIEEHNTSYTLSHVITLKEIPLKNIYENTTYYFVVNSTDPRGNSAQTVEYMLVLTPPEHERAAMPFILRMPPPYSPLWWISLATFILIPITLVMVILRYKSRRYFNSLGGKPVRTETLMCLYTFYPEKSRPEDISEFTNIPMNGVLDALQDMSCKFNMLNSFLGRGLVDKIEYDNKTYYRISNRGKSLIKRSDYG